MCPIRSHPLTAGKLPGELLGRLIAQYRTPSDDAIIVGARYGFDAAALSIGGETIVVKSDPITFATEDAAWYLVAVNANDIACMGGMPRWLTVVALLPEDTTTASVEALFGELRDACVQCHVSLIGGHTEITPGIDRPLLIGTMLGLTGPTGLVAPGNASAGDELFVTKWIGIEGTALLAHERENELLPVIGRERVDAAKSLLRNPGISIVRDARAAIASGVVTALHDPTEGGLATAVHEIAAASSLGATIDRQSIPVLSETEAICDHFGINPLGLLSSGALLIAAKQASERPLCEAAAASGIAVTRIGHLTEPGEGVNLTSNGVDAPLPRYDADELTRAL